MGEKLLDIKEHKSYLLEICWGLPPAFERHNRDICSVYVKSKTNESIIFVEQTHISNEAELIAKNVKNLEEKLIDYTFKKAKDRIDSRKYQRGKTYSELFEADNINWWLDKVQLMSKQ